MVSKVSISAAEGGGPTSSTGLMERRVLRSSTASGIGLSGLNVCASTPERGVTNAVQRLEFAAIPAHHCALGFGGASMSRTGKGAWAVAVLVIGLALWGPPQEAFAQLFDATPMLRPPADVPSVPSPPPQNHSPPSQSAAPKGPMLQSLPPSANPGPAHVAPAAPPGQGTLALSARFGKDLPLINGGLYWRVYRIDQNGVPKLVKEDKAPAPSFSLAPGTYVVSVAFGLASA